MRYLLLILSFLLFPFSSQAHDVQCMPEKVFLKKVFKEHEEAIQFLGIRGQSIITLFVNPVTRSWTLAQRTSNNTVCVILWGEDGRVLTIPFIPPLGDDM